MNLRYLAILGAIWTAFGMSAGNPPCPETPLPSLSSDRIPVDVCIPAGFKDVPVTYFDDFSWRTFLAMVWPVSNGHRGEADAGKRVSDAGARVFETYKSLWEVFHDDGSAPVVNFGAYDTAAGNACRVTPAFGDLVLASASGVGDIGQAGNGELDGPLVAQNGKYVRYLTLYNRIAFDYIVGNKFYLRSHLPEIPSPRPLLPVLRFPEGSIAIKAAWIEMEGLPEALRQRYYTRTAFVRDPASGKCSEALVGLAGLHIIQKTPSRPQWIWTSFEQVDNVPPAQFGAPGIFAFHDASKTAPMEPKNPLPLVPLAPEPVRPFNVTRTLPIHPKTVLTNLQYQELLKGSVWRNYQLVVTQWPRLDGDQAAPVPASQAGDIQNTFPGAGAFSAFANVSMETFDQSRPQLGCMSCHNRARMNVDFMWSVTDRAWPAKLAPAAALPAN